jgi:antibiotic biosynthesis monooxygenase (ABM) superfamily enzyme
MESPLDADQDSVTWVVEHRVRTSRIARFETWLGGVKAEVSRFPGWQGVTILRPSDHDGPTAVYVLVIRFASYADLKRWEGSAERLRWLRELQPLVVAAPMTRSSSGLETWFQLPGGIAAPPKWKMAILVLVAIFPLVVLVTSGLGLVASGHSAIGLPVRFDAGYLTRTLLTAITLVILMTWVAMPALSRLARRWLHPGTEPTSRRPSETRSAPLRPP